MFILVWQHYTTLRGLFTQGKKRGGMKGWIINSSIKKYNPGINPTNLWICEYFSHLISWFLELLLTSTKAVNLRIRPSASCVGLWTRCSLWQRMSISLRTCWASVHLGFKGSLLPLRWGDFSWMCHPTQIHYMKSKYHLTLHKFSWSVYNVSSMGEENMCWIHLVCLGALKVTPLK